MSRSIVVVGLVAVVIAAIAIHSVVFANPLDDRFQYSGVLSSPASLHFGNGVCDMEFRLFDSEQAGTQVGAVEVVDSVPVVDFQYAVALNATGLFGVDAFKGDERFMAVGTRCTPGDSPADPPSTGPFEPQTQRARLVTVPFALWAQDAGVDLSGLWNILGNAGTDPTVNFVGTVDDNALAFRTNSAEHMRLDTFGNVGIGTMSPLVPLHVVGEGSVRARVQGDEPGLSLVRDAGAGSADLGYVGDNDDVRLQNLVGGASLVLRADGSVCLGSGC